PNFRFRFRGQGEGHLEHDDLLMVESTVVVAEFEEVTVYDPALVVRIQDFRGFDDLFDEEGVDPVRCQEVKVLPDGAADAARDTGIVLEPGETRDGRSFDEIRDRGAAFRCETATVDVPVVGLVVDHEAAKALVSDQDVGAGAEQEPGDILRPSLHHGRDQLILCMYGDEEVRRAADPVGSEGTQRHMCLKVGNGQGGGHVVSLRAHVGNIAGQCQSDTARYTPLGWLRGLCLLESQQPWPVYALTPAVPKPK